MISALTHHKAYVYKDNHHRPMGGGFLHMMKRTHPSCCLLSSRHVIPAQAGTGTKQCAQPVRDINDLDPMVKPQDDTGVIRLRYRYAETCCEKPSGDATIQYNNARAIGATLLAGLLRYARNDNYPTVTPYPFAQAKGI